MTCDLLCIIDLYCFSVYCTHTVLYTKYIWVLSNYHVVLINFIGVWLGPWDSSCNQKG